MLHSRGRMFAVLLMGALLAWGSFSTADAANVMHHVAGPNPAQIQQMIQQAQRQQQQMMQQLQQMMQQRAQMMAQQQQRMMQQAQVAGQQVARQQQMMARRQQIAARQMQRRAAVASRNMARNMRNMPRPVLKNVVAEYEFIVADDGIVRSMNVLGPELDENGKVKKLNAEEKKKLKGEDEIERKLIGYKAGVEDLQPGDEVIVTLSRYRPAKTSKSKAAEDADSEKGTEKAADKKEEKEVKKDADKEGASDEMTDHDRITKLANWKRYGKLHGVIVEADAAGSRRMTIAIQGQQMVMQKPGQNNPPANAKPTHIDIDPSTLQATFLVIVKRGEGMPAGGGGAGTGFGFGK